MPHLPESSALVLVCWLEEWAGMARILHASWRAQADIDVG